MSRIQPYFNSEFIASGQSTEFYEFITKLTQAKSKTEESSHVTEELTRLSNKMGLPDVSSTRMRDYLIRLIHCYMLGYRVDFAIIYAIMASQSGGTPGDRRVGYLACTLFLEKDHELGIMLINTLQRDLKSANYLDQCAALNAICYLQDTIAREMVEGSVLDLVIRAMEFPKQIVRKKAVMALYFLYSGSTTNILLDRIEEPLRRVLHDKDTSVVFAVLSVWKLILVDHAEEFKDLLPIIYATHRQIIEKRIHKSFLYHGVLAPWAQLDCLGIYRIYHDMNIGAPKEHYQMILNCLESVKDKVDAAFAIVLECVKLLSAIDPILLSSFSTINSSEGENNPFEVLTWYLGASNHNLKYLGLVGMAYVDQTFWKDDWIDLLGNTIRDCSEDDTIIAQAIENLDGVIDLNVLQLVTPGIIEALSRNYHVKSCNATIAYWLINRIVEYHQEQDAWLIESVLYALAESRKNLDDDYIETQCSLLREVLIGEVEDTKKRQCSVNITYKLLKRTNSDDFSPLWIQFAFWTLGENGYLSNEISDLDIMQQLLKWIVLVQDDYLQSCGLQAIKRCILRSKKWLSGLEKILKEYKKSPVLEKQEIARELLGILNDVQFEKELQETDLTLSSSFTKLSVNPNRPSGIGRFMSDNVGTDIPPPPPSSLSAKKSFLQQNKRLSTSMAVSVQFNNNNQASGNSDSSASSSSSTRGSHHHNRVLSSRTTTEPIPFKNDNLVSSLIDLHPNNESMMMTTEEFGQLWVTCTFEEKKRFECSISNCQKLAKRLFKSWHIQIIQVIGQEFIALDKQHDVLLHVAMLSSIGQFELSLKANDKQQIHDFLKSKKLL